MIEFEFVLLVSAILFPVIITYVVQKFFERNTAFRNRVEVFLLDEWAIDPVDRHLDEWDTELLAYDTSEQRRMTAENFSQLQQHNKKIMGEDALLGKRKLREIRYLLRQFAESNATIQPELKALCKKFAEQYEQYASLFKKLQIVRSALMTGRNELIDDQLIIMVPVENPILVVKQYLQDKHWYVVPTSSQITDKDSLLSWLVLRSIHPLHKDNFLKPKPYNNLPTRYVWHELTQDYCLAQELVEKAAILRAQAKTLGNAWHEIKKNQPKLSQTPQSFFAATDNELPRMNDAFRTAINNAAFSG
ncbi:hypothetical protein [Legionella drancourtii]|uniref:Uncharacterized protein n=1 Tax=Legionella drancourtii LLAP12 TaxID=658187 RepID=G9ES49_9GAMM|nr:hypothetical protein [Legionella drancourtii]EHL29830.1 hypothetical protein LDG_8122 [Legionella drancourtii LLAP12]